ncbi:MAG: hypothetical protein KKA81_00360 [Bacteroidetes bacterium]|nr:hypothetical protein [Bacteroidota bacterium]
MFWFITLASSLFVATVTISFLILYNRKSEPKKKNLSLTVLSIVITTIFTAVAIIFAYQQYQINETLQEIQQQEITYRKDYNQKSLKMTFDDIFHHYHKFYDVELYRKADAEGMGKYLNEFRRMFEKETMNPELLANDSLSDLWFEAINICRLHTWPSGLPETDKLNREFFSGATTTLGRIINEIYWMLNPEAYKAAIEDVERRKKEEQSNDSLNNLKKTMQGDTGNN